MFKRNISFFVLTTGRSGSYSFAMSLDQHPDVVCRHESFPDIIRLSTEFAYGEKSDQIIRRELQRVFAKRLISKNPLRLNRIAKTLFPGCIKPKRTRGEVDQKFGNLVPLLNSLYPDSKFIWLLRDGRSVVASTFARKWFSKQEQMVADKNGKDIGQKWVYYRLRGDRSGDLLCDQWNRMSTFEKNCWYWTYWNRTIEINLNSIDEERWMVVQLEKLPMQLASVCRFLGISAIELPFKKVNEGRIYSNHPLWTHIELPVNYRKWHELQKKQFENICGSMMDTYYPDWRTRD